MRNIMSVYKEYNIPKSLQLHMMHYSGIKPEEITDESIASIIEELKEFSL